MSAADYSQIDAVIDALYDVISGPPGPRDWERQRSLFLDHARMMPAGLRANGDTGLRNLSVDAFIESAQDFLNKEPFYEVEISREEFRFGNVAEVRSIYECRNTPEGEAYLRGINLIHMIRYQERWWIGSMCWDNERDGIAIPGQYLSSG